MFYVATGNGCLVVDAGDVQCFLIGKSGVPVKGQLSLLADANGRVRVDVSSEAGNLLFALASYMASRAF